MKTLVYPVLLCHLLILAPVFCKSQTKTVEVITLSLDAASISAGGFPFDVPFLMKFPRPENAAVVQFKYRISERSMRGKKWVTFPSGSDIERSQNDNEDGWTRPSDSREWNKKKGNDVTLLCRGLHPNMRYDFSFDIFREFKLDEKTKLSLKEAMAAKINTFFIDALSNGYTDADKQSLASILEQELNTAIGNACAGGVTLREICYPYNSFAIRLNSSTDIGKAFDRAFGNFSNIQNTLFSRTEDISSICSTFQNDALAINTAIANVPDQLNAESKALLSQPVSPDIDLYKSLKYDQAFRLLARLTADPAAVKSFLNGTSVWQNGTMMPGTDSGSNVLLLYGLLQKLGNGKILLTNNTNPFALLAGEDYTRPINALLPTVSDIKKWEAQRVALINSFPDLTLQILGKETVMFETITIADISTEKTPYISAEAGIGYTPAFRSAYSYYGANFYFLPVNKQARLSSFKGWNRVGKMLCFNIGIANFFGVRPANTYSLLGTSAGTDLTVGLGVRLTNIVKLNVGCLAYRTNNNNPLSDKKRIDASFYTSIGVDVNLLKAFSSVATALRLM